LFERNQQSPLGTLAMSYCIEGMAQRTQTTICKLGKKDRLRPRVRATALINARWQWAYSS
jgi:hypothetical protein